MIKKNARKDKKSPGLLICRVHAQLASRTRVLRNIYINKFYKGDQDLSKHVKKRAENQF